MVMEDYNNIATDCLLNLHCCLFQMHMLGNAYDNPT